MKKTLIAGLTGLKKRLKSLEFFQDIHQFRVTGTKKRISWPARHLKGNSLIAECRSYKWKQGRREKFEQKGNIQ
jgi:hypothetical protein